MCVYRGPAAAAPAAAAPAAAAAAAASTYPWGGVAFYVGSGANDAIGTSPWKDARGSQERGGVPHLCDDGFVLGWCCFGKQVVALRPLGPALHSLLPYQGVACDLAAVVQLPDLRDRGLVSDVVLVVGPLKRGERKEVNTQQECPGGGRVCVGVGVGGRRTAAASTFCFTCSSAMVQTPWRVYGWGQQRISLVWHCGVGKEGLSAASLEILAECAC